MSSKLLPCPFCGGHVDRATRKPAGMDVDFVINCQKCYLKFSPFCATEEDCERLWNLRAVLAQEAGPVVERKEPVAWIIQWGSIIPGFQGHREVVLKVPDLISNSAVVTPLYTSPPAPVAVKPVVWRVPVNGDWFYGTKEQCVRERSEFESTFTAEDFEDAGAVTPEPLACLDKVKELNQ